MVAEMVEECCREKVVQFDFINMSFIFPSPQTPSCKLSSHREQLLNYLKYICGLPAVSDECLFTHVDLIGAVCLSFYVLVFPGVFLVRFLRFFYFFCPFVDFLFLSLFFPFVCFVCLYIF